MHQFKNFCFFFIIFIITSTIYITLFPEDVGIGLTFNPGPNPLFEEEKQIVSIINNDNNNQLAYKNEIKEDNYENEYFKCIPRKDYEHAMLTINEIKQSIWNTWDISNYPLFLSFMDIPSMSWEIQRNKFVKLILADRHKPNMSFVVGFSGTSVTAGHDSYFAEAFPNVFYERMKPIMSLLGINFQVRNHALGNNPCYPYDACLSTHLGDDLDIVVWEQSMFCGRDARPVETFTRSAIRMKKKPSILYLLSGTPTWSKAYCENTTDTDHSLSDKEKFLLNSTLQDITENTNHMKTMTFLKNRVLGSRTLADVYFGAAPMGQNVLELEKYKCKGPYDKDFCEKTTGGGNEWHPGKKGHQFRGDNLVYNIISILEDAFAELSNSIDSCKGPEALSQGSSALSPALNYSASFSQLKIRHSSYSSTDMSIILKKSIEFIRDNTFNKPPDPPQICSSEDCVDPSNCFTDFEPKMQNSLKSLVVGKKPHDSRIPSIYNGLPVHNLEEPRESHEYDHHGRSGWSLELSFFDKTAVGKGIAMGYGYIDRKYIFLSHGNGSYISFRIKPKRSINPIWLCEVQKGFLKYPSNVGELDKSSRIYLFKDVPSYIFNNETFEITTDHLNGASDQLSIPHILPISHVVDSCFRSSVITNGQHIITVMQKDVRQINIAYLIYW